MPTREPVCKEPVQRRFRGLERSRTESGSRSIRDRRGNRTSNPGCSGRRHMLVWRNNLERTPSHADQRVLLGYLFGGRRPQRGCDPASSRAGPRRHGMLRTAPSSATDKLEDDRYFRESKRTPYVDQKTTGLTCSKTVRCSLGLKGKFNRRQSASAGLKPSGYIKRSCRVGAGLQPGESDQQTRMLLCPQRPARTYTMDMERKRTRASPTAPRLAPAVDLARHRLRR